MGSSGAGKTTLLDVLAQRKTIGKIEGEILLNGESLKIDFDRLTGYVEQMGIESTNLHEVINLLSQLQMLPIQV